LSRKTVSWFASARDDVDAIIDYLRDHGSHVNAERVFDRLMRAAGSLPSSPNRGRIVAEFAAYGISQYREIVEPPWRIIYRVELREIIILTVVDARRQLDDILLERLIRVE
jgi:toxin ParE1/3/4